MRNLEDIGTKVSASAENRLLAGWFHVAGEQQPQARDGDHDHQALVILGRGFVLAVAR